MFKFTKLLVVMSICLLSGCATEFKGPEVVYSRGQSCMIYTRQGSIPESAIYRDVWPISPVVVVTNQPKSKFLTIPIIGSIISTVGSVSRVFTGADKSGKCYRYRDDIVIIGTNINVENISAILEKVTVQHTDAQRSGWLPATQAESFKKGE